MANALQLARFHGVFHKARHHVGRYLMPCLAIPDYQPRQVMLLDDDATSAELLEESQRECGLSVKPSSSLL